MIQGGIIPQLFHEKTFPNFMEVVGIPRLGELTHNAVLSSASAASNAFSDFKTYFDDFRTGLGKHINIPSTYGALNRFVYGEKWPNFGDSIGEVPSQVVAPRILGNYRGVDGGAASVASSAANSAASEGLAKRLALV